MNPTFKKCFILFCMLINTPALAKLWPVFTMPDEKFLLSQGYISTQNCPRGQGKIISNTIPMKPLCKTYCPDSWKWIISSNNHCFDLKDLKMQGCMVGSVQEEPGIVSYSDITVYFGKNGKNPTFKISFTTPKENWLCVQHNDAIIPSITCANDTVAANNLRQNNLVKLKNSNTEDPF